MEEIALLVTWRHVLWMNWRVPAHRHGLMSTSPPSSPLMWQIRQMGMEIDVVSDLSPLFVLGAVEGKIKLHVSDLLSMSGVQIVGRDPFSRKCEEEKLCSPDGVNVGVSPCSRPGQTVIGRSMPSLRLWPKSVCCKARHCWRSPVWWRWWGCGVEDVDAKLSDWPENSAPLEGWDWWIGWW